MLSHHNNNKASTLTLIQMFKITILCAMVDIKIKDKFSDLFEEKYTNTIKYTHIYFFELPFN